MTYYAFYAPFVQFQTYRLYIVPMTDKWLWLFIRFWSVIFYFFLFFRITQNYRLFHFNVNALQAIKGEYTQQITKTISEKNYCFLNSRSKQSSALQYIWKVFLNDENRGPLPPSPKLGQKQLFFNGIVTGKETGVRYTEKQMINIAELNIHGIRVFPFFRETVKFLLR